MSRAATVSRGGSLVRQYALRAGDDLTYAVWVLEGERGASALSWRRVARSLGVVDPMQDATPPGRANRRIQGERLRMGLVLTGR